MKATTAPQIDIGISAKERRRIADGLAKVLADTYTLYLKTHNFHWNVTGPMFNTLHLMFEAQYNELALAVDLVAERIRALGFPAPGSYSAYAKLSSIKRPKACPRPRTWSRSSSKVTKPWRARRAACSALPRKRAISRPPTC